MTPDIFEARVDFLERLNAMTSMGKLQWQQGRNEYWFSVEMRRHTYAITSEDSDDFAPFAFRIFPPGDADERSELAEWEWDRSGESPVNEAMRHLYLTVKRSVVSMDPMLSDMLKDIEEVENDVD